MVDQQGFVVFDLPVLSFHSFCYKMGFWQMSMIRLYNLRQITNHCPRNLVVRPLTQPCINERPGGRAESERGYALFIMAAAFKAADHFSNNASHRVPKVAMAALDNGAAAWRPIEHAADTQVKFNITPSKRHSARPTEPICIACPQLLH